MITTTLLLALLAGAFVLAYLVDRRNARVGDDHELMSR